MKNLPLKGFSLILLLVFIGCDALSTKVEPLSLNEAHKKFIDVLKNEYELDVVVRPKGNTLWIYLPLESSLFQMKAKKEGPKSSDTPSNTMSLNYLEGTYDMGSFFIDYDISQSKAYAKDYGYGNNYSEEYRKAQRYILTAISRVFTETKETDETIRVDVMNRQLEEADLKVAVVKEGEAPLFYVIVVADVKGGIETKMWIHSEDLKRGMIDHSFQEEYARRAVQDYPLGHTSIIGDKTGEHLVYFDLKWPDFLIKQMIYRIRFKYTQSDIKPTENTEGEILDIVAKVTQAYEFTDFVSVKLNNKASDEQFEYTIEDLPQID